MIFEGDMSLEPKHLSESFIVTEDLDYRRYGFCDGIMLEKGEGRAPSQPSFAYTLLSTLLRARI